MRTINHGIILTRDPNLGKVVLYQLSYSRMTIDELIVVQK